MKKNIIASVVFFITAFVFAEKGHLVNDFPIAELQYREFRGTNQNWILYLYNDYGFVVKWEEPDKPSFFLYDKIKTNILATSDLEIFLNGLSNFPDGAVVAEVDSCAAGLSYGMPKKMLLKIYDIIKKKKFKMAGIEEKNFVLCTCETTNVLFFTKAQNSKENDY